MEDFVRFTFRASTWIIMLAACCFVLDFLLLPLVLSIWSSSSRSSRIGFCSVSLLLLLPGAVLLVSLLWAWQGWWLPIKRTFPPMTAEIHAEPIDGTFIQSESVLLNLQITNRSAIDIIKVELDLPFRNAVVVDYHHAMPPLERGTFDHFLAHTQIHPTESLALSIPIQVTKVGEHNGWLTIEVSGLAPFDHEPMGFFGRSDSLIRSHSDDIQLDWIVLQAQP